MKITCNKTISHRRAIEADSAADMRAKYKQRRADAHTKKYEYIKNEIKNSSDPLETAFDEFVPTSGPSDSLGGELVRAMMRLMYRSLNDGDKFFDGYGIETCADAASFIWNYAPGKVGDMVMHMGEQASRYLENDDLYDEDLKKMSDALMAALLADFDKYFTKEPGEYDFQEEDGEAFVNENNFVPLYDIDLDIPDELQRHIDAGNISDNDIQWEIEGWIELGSEAEVSVESGWISITNITSEAYTELSNSGDTWLSSYARNLDEEFGNPEEEEEGEEEEEE